MDNLITLLAVIAGYFMGNSNARTLATERAAQFIDKITGANTIKILKKREPQSIDDQRYQETKENAS